MAIAYDTSVDGGSNNQTWSHTVASGAGLFVFVTELNGTDAATTCDYNGTAMSLIASKIDSGQYTSYVFFLANPTSGTHNVNITASGNSAFNHGISVSYTGLGSTQPDSHNEAIITTSPTTTNTTVVASNCWTIGFAIMNQYSVPTSTGTTRKSSTFADFPANTSGIVVADSNGTVSTGSQGFTFTQASATDGISIVISVRDTTPLATAQAGFLLMMV